jgi:hypothetical protein
VSHVNALRLQLAGQRLGQSTQRELAHGEGRGLGVALDAGRGPGEENRTLHLREHALGRCLRHQEAAKGRDLDCPLHLGGVEIHDGPARPVAGVIEYDVEAPETDGRDR